jgi:hypothetical protein
MSFDSLMRFSADLRQLAGVDNSLRRIGEELVLRVGESEFVFDRDGRYAGTGGNCHASLADLVVDLERRALTSDDPTR